MPKRILIITLIVAALAAAALVFLATWEIPAPSERVEKVLPDDQFPR